MAFPGPRHRSRMEPGSPISERCGVSPAPGKRGIARPVPDLEGSMANKPFKDVTNRDLFADSSDGAL
jgi:hypothetical protein